MSSLSSDVLLTVLLYLEWNDYVHCLSDDLFDAFHPLLSSKPFLLALCQRDLYVQRFDDLPHLSPSIQIYIFSYLLRRIEAHSFSKFACRCGPEADALLSKIFSFSELIRIFVTDLCICSRDLSSKNDMREAFRESRSVRIGITKTILSHPLCVLREMSIHCLRKRGRYQCLLSARDAIRCGSMTRYRICPRGDDIADEFQEDMCRIENFVNDDLVENWELHVDYAFFQTIFDPLSYDKDWDTALLLFFDNFQGTKRCAIYAFNYYSDHGCRDDTTFEDYMIFDETTPLQQFRDLFWHSARNSLWFPCAWWSKSRLERQLASTTITDPRGEDWLNEHPRWHGFDTHVLAFFYPFIQSGCRSRDPLLSHKSATNGKHKRMFEAFQTAIHKYTAKTVRFAKRAELYERRCIDMLDAVCGGDLMRQSKVLKQAVERGLRRIVNSLLMPYLKQCCAYMTNDELFELMKAGTFEQAMEENRIRSNGARPASWPCLFYTMAMHWIPVLYQCIRFDLSDVKKPFNERSVNKKLLRFGLILDTNTRRNCICDRLMILRAGEDCDDTIDVD